MNENTNKETLEYRVTRLEEEIAHLKQLLYIQQNSKESQSCAGNIKNADSANSASSINNMSNTNNASTQNNISQNTIHTDKQQAPLQPIRQEQITINHARLFYSYFRGREDVYSLRSGKPNPKTGKFGYFTQCDNFWKSGVCPRKDGQRISCSNCPAQSYTRINAEAIISHLQGNKQDCSDVVGLYPIHKNETCYFIAYDFDQHDTDNNLDQLETDMKQIYAGLKQIEIPFLLERSRSGRGYHLWVFFAEPMPAHTARRFGHLLLLKLQELASMSTFAYFDRLIPMQDELPFNKKTGRSGLGNLIALPLQGQAIKQHNSVFVDEHLVAYHNQWQHLQDTQKLSKQTVCEKIEQWKFLDTNSLLEYQATNKYHSKNTHKSSDLNTAEKSRMLNSNNSHTINNKPWDSIAQKFDASDVTGEIQIVLSDKLYVNYTKVSARLQNYIRQMAAFANPKFYKNKQLGYSNYSTSRIIYCGHNEGDYICLPRGIKDQLLDFLDSQNYKYKFEDKRNSGKKIDVTFNGSLYPEQEDAVNTALKYNNCVIAATTAFGKTVVGANLISQRKVNTLILVHTREIMENWVNDLNKFLNIDEELPTYKTKSGLTRTRKNLIGRLYSQHNSLTGIIDVVMCSSLGKKDNINPIVKNYGMLIMDECHHGAAQTVENVVSESTAKYIYGLTATPKREDGLEKKIYLQFGPIKYKYTAKQRAEKMKIDHFVYPRFTRFISEKKLNINQAYAEIIMDPDRNQLIINDVKDSIKNKKNPLVITKFKKHADLLNQKLNGIADETILMYGGFSKAEKDKVRQQLLDIPKSKSIILIATCQYIGEGFNFPRLDTLMLTVPVAWEGNIEQYAGRLHRDYETKTETIIYDYIDNNVPMFQRMFQKRMKAYKKIGYSICKATNTDTKLLNTFYSHNEYFKDFKTDIENCNKSIYISSPGINKFKVDWLCSCIKEFNNKPISVVIETLDSAQYPDVMIEKTEALLDQLKSLGVTINTHEKLGQYFCIIDNKIVWYGNMNVLSREKPENNIMRIIDEETAQELKLFFKVTQSAH